MEVALELEAHGDHARASYHDCAQVAGNTAQVRVLNVLGKIPAKIRSSRSRSNYSVQVVCALVPPR